MNQYLNPLVNTIDKTVSLNWKEDRWETSAGIALSELASHFRQGVTDKSDMVYCYWLIVTIPSWLDREIAISGRYNLLFLMCLITPGARLSARSDFSSELIYPRTASFFWRCSPDFLQNWNFPVGRNSSKILSAQVTSKNYRTKNNLLLLIRLSIFLYVYVFWHSYRNKNKKFNLLPLTELWHACIVIYTIDNVFDIFQTLSFFSCLVSQFLDFDLHLL